VANFLLQQRRVVPDSTLVSPRMLYEMAAAMTNGRAKRIPAPAPAAR